MKRSTTLLLSGIPVHVAAARLGHADPAITLRVYAHAIRSAAAIFADAVKAACQQESPCQDRKRLVSWEPPIGIEPMTYALRGGLHPSTAVQAATSILLARLIVPQLSGPVQGRC
jgi:hypothetical protein